MKNINWTKLTADNSIIKAKIIQEFQADISGIVFA